VKNKQLQVISKSLQLFKSDLTIEKQRVELVLDNQSKTIKEMKKSRKNHKFSNDSLSEMKILKAVVPREEISETGDDKETMVARKADKDDSGRESDSSDHTCDEEDAENKSAKSTKNINESKTVLIYSYWTHYI
jgi:hypothetical protein